MLATLDAFESGDVLAHGLRLSKTIQAGLLRLQETPLVTHIRGEGCVWGIECNEHAGHSAADVANACVQACYLGDEHGRAIHLLGPLASKVIRVSPPLVMPIEEAETYFEAMFGMFNQVATALQATTPDQ